MKIAIRRAARRQERSGGPFCVTRLSLEGDLSTNNDPAACFSGTPLKANDARHIIACLDIAESGRAETIRVAEQSSVFKERIDAGEVGMVEYVQQRRVEFKAGAFAQLKSLEERKIGRVCDCVLHRVSWCVAKRSSEH